MQPAAALPRVIYDFQSGNITVKNFNGEIALDVVDPVGNGILRFQNARYTSEFPRAIIETIYPTIGWANYGGAHFDCVDAGDVIVPITDPVVFAVYVQVDIRTPATIHIEVVNCLIPEPATTQLEWLAIGSFLTHRHRRKYDFLSTCRSDSLSTLRQEERPYGSERITRPVRGFSCGCIRRGQ